MSSGHFSGWQRQVVRTEWCRERQGRVERMTESPLAVYQAGLEAANWLTNGARRRTGRYFIRASSARSVAASRLEWRVSAGLGTVYATTVTHPREGAPYNVALIDCDEGFRLMSRVEDIAPEAVQIGMRVRFRVHRPGGGEPPYPVFAPLETG